MNVFHPAALIASLMLALAGVSHSAQADRNDHRNHDQRADDFSMHSRSIETRGNGRYSSQPTEDGGSRTQWRERNDSNLRPSDGYRHANDRDRDNDRYNNDRNDNNRYDTGRRYESRERGVNSQEQLFNQRFYDDRRDNSGYYRRDNPRPVNDVIREVQHRYGGQVIGVQNSEGGSMYRVRVLQHDGRVKTVLVPAE